MENASTENASTSSQGWKLENASTENVSMPVNTNCGDYDGTLIAFRMSITLPWFLSIQGGPKRHHFCTP